MARDIWQENYLGGRYNRWPYDAVVSLMMRHYGRADRGTVRVLDLGCGGGNNTLFLANSGFDFRAIDAAPEGVRLTKELVGLAADDARVQVADFISLPFADGEFDVVVERASLCCNLTPDLKRAVGEVRRVLKTGGRFIGVDMYSENTADLKYGVSLGNGDYNGFTGGMFIHSREVHAFTPEQIRTFFGGFAIESLARVTVADCLDGHVREHFNLVARKEP